jgi:nucleoside-diphosphate-sugar epimerase
MKGKDARVSAEKVAAWSIGVSVVPRAGARTVENGQRDLVNPAVNGTKNVLGAVAKSLDTVKRVVLTSSFAGALAVAMRLHRAFAPSAAWHNQGGSLGLCFAR